MTSRGLCGSASIGGHGGHGGYQPRWEGKYALWAGIGCGAWRRGLLAAGTSSPGHACAAGLAHLWPLPRSPAAAGLAVAAAVKEGILKAGRGLWGPLQFQQARGWVLPWPPFPSQPRGQAGGRCPGSGCQGCDGAFPSADTSPPSAPATPTSPGDPEEMEEQESESGPQEAAAAAASPWSGPGNSSSPGRPPRPPGAGHPRFPRLGSVACAGGRVAGGGLLEPSHAGQRVTRGFLGDRSDLAGNEEQVVMAGTPSRGGSQEGVAGATWASLARSGRVPSPQCPG